MICMDWRHIEELIAVGKAGGFDLINLCVWNKTNGGMGSLYRSKHELVCIFKKPGAPHINNVELGKHGRNRTNVWDYAGVNSFGAGREADLCRSSHGEADSFGGGCHHGCEPPRRCRAGRLWRVWRDLAGS